MSSADPTAPATAEPGRTPIVVPDLADAAIRLRRPVEADVPALVEALADPEIPRWTLVPQPYGEAEARDFIRIGVEGPAAGTDVVFAWDVRRGSRPAGRSGGHPRHRGRRARRSATGPRRGAAGAGSPRAAVRLACGWALDPSGLGLDVVQWRAVDGNAASPAGRRARRLPSITGLRRLSVVQRGVRRDDWCGDLLRGELR